MTTALLFAFLLVFIRCSAMLISSPVFGAQSTPLMIRIFTTLAIAGSLTFAVQPSIGPPPTDLYTLCAAVFGEVLAGLLLGSFMTLALQAAQIAGGLLDLQVGLGMSQVLNPLGGVSVTVIAQFKFLMSVVIFLQVNGHHTLLAAFAASYESMPQLTMAALPAIRDGYLGLLQSVCLLAFQIATPVIAVSLVVDAALGLINKAVPQMPAMMLGMPAKTAMGLLTLGLTLPLLSGSVSTGVELAAVEIGRFFR